MGFLFSLWMENGAVPRHSDWITFAVLVGLALLTEVYRSEPVRDVSHSALALLEFASLLLLPTPLFMLLVALPLLFTWGRVRLQDRRGLFEWYKVAFNFSMTIISASAALLWGRWLIGSRLDPSVYSSGMALAVGSAALVMVVVNHLLLGTVVTVAQGSPLREIARRDPHIVLTDFALFLLGYILAILWTLNPWLTLLALAPLYLAYRALWVPRLEQASQTDSKTGLLNAQHFMRRAAAELAAMQRQRQPMAILMADLDLLREVNNRFGHLAGDVVLEGIGKVIRDTIRQGDIAGRFGGEEFAIVLPNTALPEAQAIAGRLRKAVETMLFTVETEAQPLRITMSIGVASYPAPDTSLAQLLHEADIAVYYAKERGRNCVATHLEVPPSYRQTIVGDKRGVITQG